jgi:hypothetical protein
LLLKVVGADELLVQISWIVDRGGYHEAGLVSSNAVSQDLLKSYERGLYEHCALHAGDPHWGGMIAERKP